MGEKTANPGHFTVPTAPGAGVTVTSATANNFTAAYVALGTSPSALYITGAAYTAITSTAVPGNLFIQIATGATGAEAIVDQEIAGIYINTPAVTGQKVGGYIPIMPPVPVATTTRLSAKTADSAGSVGWILWLSCIAQAGVVDDGVAESANTTQLAGQTVTAAAGVTFPTSVASPTNITSASGITVATNSDKTGYSLTQTFPTNFSALAVTTGGAVTVGTNSDKTGYSLTQTFPTNFSALALTTGGHVSNVDTLTTYTGNTPQTGDAYARIGAAGAGLTALGDSRIANLDATVSSRSTYAGGAVASVTAAVTVGTNNDKTGYSLTQAFPTNFAALAVTTGGHVANVDTLTTYTGDTPQTGDAYARVGAAGAGLTALGDTRIANLDATVSSRSTYAGGAVASVTAPVAITSNVKKNSAFLAFMFIMTDSTLHAPLAGLTVTATRSLDGAAFASCVNSPAGISSGWYVIDLDPLDTNGNRIALRFTATGADDTNIEINTQP